MLSLTKRTRTLSLKSQAIRQSNPTAHAVRLAICANRIGSPAARDPTVLAIMSEIAEVGPTASWRDDPRRA
jgi:hypothetical protein